MILRGPFHALASVPDSVAPPRLEVELQRQQVAGGDRDHTQARVRAQPGLENRGREVTLQSMPRKLDTHGLAPDAEKALGSREGGWLYLLLP